MVTDIFGNLGHNNRLIYRSQEDMKFFKLQTRDSILLMGRKTYDSLPDPQPLIDRGNKLIVFSRLPRESKYDDVHYLRSPELFMNNIEVALNKMGATEGQRSNFISIGGSSLFSLVFLEFMEQYFDTISLYMNVMRETKIMRSTTGLIYAPIRDYQKFFDNITTQRGYNDFSQVMMWKTKEGTGKVFPTSRS